MAHTPSATSLSFALRGAPSFTVQSAPTGLRTLFLAGTAVVSGIVCFLRRPGDAIRKRIIRRLDRIAPRVRFNSARVQNGQLFNTECPVCLCDFAAAPDRPIRILECRHALCSDCLEVWAVHCTKAHLNPVRFGVTRSGHVVSWTPGPKCPLCCARLKCVPDEDLRQAILAAIQQRGAAISSFLAFQAQSSSMPADVPSQDAVPSQLGQNIHSND